MSANMERKMFASKTKNPWWSFGNKNENYVYPNATNEELLVLSKADFPVNLVDLSQYNEKYDGYYLLENGVTKDILRQCRGRFQPLQTTKFLSKISPLGNITDIGAIGKGEKVFFSIDAGSFSVGEGNTHKSYINAVLPHDGTMKITLGPGIDRIECQNKFNIWKKSLKEGEFLATKQTTSAGDKIDKWVKTFIELQQEVDNMKDNFLKLAKMKFSHDSQAQIIQKLFDEKDNTRSLNQQKMLAQIIGDNASKIPSSQRGTGYDIFNGVTYLTSHESVIKKNTDRLEAVLFGTAQKFAEKAFNIILGSVPDEVIEEREFARTITV